MSEQSEQSNTEEIIEQAEVVPHEVWARAEIERRRKLAYADPETGSDRFFTEASRLDAQGDSAGAQYARAAGLCRVAEIKAEFPMDATDPPDFVPTQCTRRQGRLALLQVGKLAAVESAIAGIEDESQRLSAQVEYEADTWLRTSEFLVQMWASLGGTDQELDELFKLAATL